MVEAQERQPSDPSKILIVTGGSRGIGAAIPCRRSARLCSVRQYLERGREAEGVVRAIESAGGRAIAVQADVGSEPDVVRLFGTADVQLGRVSANMRWIRVAYTQSRRICRTMVAALFTSAAEKHAAIIPRKFVLAAPARSKAFDSGVCKCFRLRVLYFSSIFPFRLNDGGQYR